MILLETAISLAFIFLAGAIFCSLLQEFIATWIKSRASLLEKTIRSMVGAEVASSIYGHPLVYAASEDQDYTPSHLTGATFARTVLDSLRSPDQRLTPLTPAEFETALKKIHHLPLRDTLSSLYGAAGGDLAALEQRLAGWYDTTMEQATAWYKRNTQVMLLGLGFFTAVSFNLDTFRMVGELWRNSALRTHLVAAAEQRVAEGTGKQTLPEARAVLAQLPFGWGTEAKVEKPAAPVPDAAIAKPAAKQGWKEDLQGFWTKFTGGVDTAGQWLVRLCGWLITAVAISLGAPVWFDLLKKLLDFRKTTTPPPAKP